ILVTRARAQASRLAQLLRAQGASVITIPSIEIRPPRSSQPLDAAVERAARGRYDWLIFTSVNGVEAFFARIQKRKGRSLALHAGVFGAGVLGAGTKLCAIGPATRAAIESRGLRVAVMPPRYIAESVVAA